MLWFISTDSIDLLNEFFSVCPQSLSAGLPAAKFATDRLTPELKSLFCDVKDIVPKQVAGYWRLPSTLRREQNSSLGDGFDTFIKPGVARLVLKNLKRFVDKAKGRDAVMLLHDSVSLKVLQQQLMREIITKRGSLGYFDLSQCRFVHLGELGADLSSLPCPVLSLRTDELNLTSITAKANIYRLQTFVEPTNKAELAEIGELAVRVSAPYFRNPDFLKLNTLLIAMAERGVSELESLQILKAEAEPSSWSTSLWTGAQTLFSGVRRACYQHPVISMLSVTAAVAYLNGDLEELYQAVASFVGFGSESMANEQPICEDDFQTGCRLA